MSTTYLFPSHYEDDTSDSLSSVGTKSISLDSIEEPSPHFVHLSTVCDMDALSSDTKKIRKKRCAYDKIDDEKRIKLLEAVQKSGESLKSAAKRLKINYSSAKSILHTFRKEGRILKKSPLESGNRPFSMCNLPSTMETSPISNAAKRVPQRFHSQGTDLPERNSLGAYNTDNGPNSPMRGLTSIFANLVIENEGTPEETSILKTLMLETQNTSETSLNIPKLEIPAFMPEIKIHPSIDPIVDDGHVKIPILTEITHNPPATEMLSHPLAVLKQLDNFYMNYSNSPLSGGKGMLFGECSDSGSRRHGPKEFDSFSDMMNAFQNQRPIADDFKGDFSIPSFFRYNSGQSTQDKAELKLIKEDSSDSTTLTRNSSSDGFTPLMDPQWLMCGALERTPFLSNFAQFQRTGISLVSERNN